MKKLSLQEKRKLRVGPVDFKRNIRAKRVGERANGFVFISMLASLVFVLSYL